MDNGKIIGSGTQDELCGAVKGKVWECRVKPDEVMDYMSRMRVSNAVSDGEYYTLRIISEDCPVKSAEQVQPTLEDVCIYHFGDM